MPQRTDLKFNVPSYSIEDYSLDEIIEPLSSSSLVSPVNSAPSDTSCEYIKSSGLLSRRPLNLNLVYKVDLRAITYENTVDENLICAICQCALIDPISTRCQHIFCSECLDNALSHSLTCPIDRSILTRESDLGSVPRIIQNQLDNLKVLCPCCHAAISRSMIANHMSKYCPESLVKCPGINTETRCSELIKRKFSTQCCLHYLSTCPDCKKLLLQIDMTTHREDLCESRSSICEKCGLEILRIKRVNHEKECLEAEIPCIWKDLGCEHQFPRKELENHLTGCDFRFLGKMAEVLKKEIKDLRSNVRTLTETNQLQERRIKFLESGCKQFDRAIEYSELPNHSLPISPDVASTEPLNSGHEYLLSLLEYQESKLSQLSAGMTELEAKQTTMLFNETIPIKNELAEIRSLQQTATMHIRWLMAFRIRENSRRSIGNNSQTAVSNIDTSDPIGAIRSSDSYTTLLHRPNESLSRDVTTKL
ncbi:TNF receptor-associated factor 6 [Erysiphe necator]|uniref:Putative traf-type zinc finger protein n=1 Tax=Uncinula necator TaxID=52586 RepID=A0A0B1P8Q7_UNCNE|nr:TNF receptor-associated factor 6 [Erysiphe necator]KHJ33720.1 putative traf-type zinc finger protein [Erysiphe necator]